MDGQLGLFEEPDTLLETEAAPVREPTMTQAEAWRYVVSELPHLKRIAARIARPGSGLDRGDLLQDLCLDLVESYTLWDPKRGSYRTWAHTRSRLARLRHFRKLGRDRVIVRQVGEAPDEEVEAGTWTNPALPPGARGNEARMEALIDLLSVYETETPEGQREMRRELYGLKRRKEKA